MKKKPKLKVIETKNDKNAYKKRLWKKIENMVVDRLDDLYLDVSEIATAEDKKLSPLEIEELVFAAYTTGITFIVESQAFNAHLMFDSLQQKP